MASISIKRILIALTVAIPALYLATCIVLFLTQRSLLYFPTPESNHSSTISIESDGEMLRILTRPADSTHAIILFGGNAEDVSHYLGSFAEALPEQNLFLVNYRGYGGSTGNPSEAALFTDALAVYDHVQKEFPNITVVGRSLGSGVAVYLASVRKVDRLILITPYDSIENVAKTHFPIFPVGLILKDKFDSASRVKDVTAKTLILIAENDSVIPRESTDDLVQTFPVDQVVVKILPGKTHDSITFGSDYLDASRAFLNSEPY